MNVLDFVRIHAPLLVDRLDSTRPRSLLLAVGGTLFSVWAIRDFLRWRRVDGGLPHNPVTWVFSHAVNLIFNRSGVTARFVRKLETDKDETRLLGALPPREGPLPTLQPWGLPQRHIPQLYSSKMLDVITQHITAAASKHNLLLATSVREGHQGLALYSQRANSLVAKPDLESDRLHVHPGDGSVHVSLHPRDAAEVCEKGWGVPFPLAGIWVLDPGLVFVYAPRNDEELQTVLRIMDAGVEFMLTKMK
ncbi:hypothetical protein EXIGLDRAFT_730531 [Exidia glandulosa HHB12029]|uniref:Luciferase domain-containing protein n=1 Tax=Exidia glandulosa HHB12029 TaxID=1314781 RepID=A0A165C5B0_EXIGL|nr:hypothetical protein EXIGLDRAFT_730531 [Exidia glandulosa HHB12029]